MSQLNPSEISSVLKEKIAGLDLSAERKNEGIIVSVSDGIVRIHGMGDVMYGELIEFENGVLGLALNLEQDSVGAVVLGDYLGLVEGQKALCTGRILEVLLERLYWVEWSTLWEHQLMAKVKLKQMKQHQ